MSILITIGSFASSGRKPFIVDSLSRRSSVAASKFVPQLNSTITKEMPSCEVEDSFFTPETVETAFSIGLGKKREGVKSFDLTKKSRIKI